MANGSLWSTNDRCPSSVGSLGSLCQYMRFFLSCLDWSSQPSTKLLFLTAHFFHFTCPHRPATWEAVVLDRLSLYICLFLLHSNSVIHVAFIFFRALLRAILLQFTLFCALRCVLGIGSLSERGLEPNKATKKSVGLFFSLDMMPPCLPHSNSVIRVPLYRALFRAISSNSPIIYHGKSPCPLRITYILPVFLCSEFCFAAEFFL
jgi:hypothetical protein